LSLLGELLQKGGDPAAPSDTATLLRLHANHRLYLRRLLPAGLPLWVSAPVSGKTNFRHVTGGVCKARERIHRRIADRRLLAIPTSWSRVADSNPN
jgi:hypothetical protein